MDSQTEMDFGEELTRAVDMLRTMPIPKLGRAVADGGPTRADQARQVAQYLADLGADAAGTPRRTVPNVGDPAVGDQVAVTGLDLIGATPEPKVLAEAAARLRALRLEI